VSVLAENSQAIAQVEAAPEKALNDALYLAIQGRPQPAPIVRFGIAPHERDDGDD